MLIDVNGNPLESGKPVFIEGEPQHFCTLEQLEEVYRVTDEMINDLSDGAFYELTGGYEKDINQLFDVMLEEAFLSLYGRKGNPEARRGGKISYFEALTNDLEEAMRKENLAYFITSVLPEFILNWHHLLWADLVMRHKKLNIIAARDHGKSYFFSHAYPLWVLYKYAGRKVVKGRYVDDRLNQNIYIVSNEMSLTELLLDIIKSTIETNDILKERLLPMDAHGKIKQNYGNKRSLKAQNGAEVRLKSYGGSFRGIHTKRIVVDDFLKDNVIYSKVQRQKSIEYFHSVIMNAAEVDAYVTVVGTPFHESDLYGDLREKRGKGSWRCFIFPSIFPDGKVLWPDRYKYEDLLVKREDQGTTIFSRELLCKPISSASSIFPDTITGISKIKGSKYTLVKRTEEHPLTFKKVSMGVDLALSATAGADYSVFTVWGQTWNNEMVLIGFWRKSGASFRDQIKVIKRFNRNYRPDIIVVEANAFQRLFVDLLEEEGLTNIVPHVTTAGNKNNFEFGLPSLAVDFERGRIIMPYGDDISKAVTDHILGEFNSIAFTENTGKLESVGEHDDCAMSTFFGKRGFTYNGSDFVGTLLG